MKVRLTFNDQEIEVEKGTLLIEAAKQAGAEIPHFCYHPKLKYDANCRMCIVHVEKMPKLQTSCSTVATEGMVVRSDTDRVKEAQNGVMAFLLGNHPLDCPECDQGGECQLQDFAHRHSPAIGSFTETKRVFEKEYFGPLIEKEMNRCVSCLRCVRYCDEVIGSNALGSIDRGSITEIGGFAHHPLDCEFCGGCIQICPVGALTSRVSMYDYRPWQVKKTDTICTYCGDGCQLTLETIGDKVIRVSSKMGMGRNEGDLCAKGFFGYGFINHPERLTRPMIVQQSAGEKKEAGAPEKALRPVTWEWAVKKAATDLAAIKAAYGPEAIGGIIGGHNTNEEVYLFHKLMRDVIGTSHIDSSARYGYINAAKGLTSVFGTTRLARYEDIVGADVILSLAGDMTETNPICALKVKEAVRKHQAKLVAIDAFNTARDTYKSHLPHIAHRHLCIPTGTERWVLIGLLKILAAQPVLRLISPEFAERIRQETEAVSFETIQQKSGVEKLALEEIAALYKNAKTAVVIVGGAIFRNRDGFANMLHVADMALLAGQVAKEGAGILALADKANEMGLCDVMGSVTPAATTGATLLEMIEKAERGEIKALYIVGQNPVDSLPQKRVKEAFAKLDLLICQDLFLTETAQSAHIVLPAASFSEKEGRYTSQEGEVQKVRKAIEPIGNSKPDGVIFSMIAEKMGAPFEYKNVNDIWKDQLASMSPQGQASSIEEVTSHIAAYCNTPRVQVPPASPLVNGAADHFYIQMGPSLFHSGKISTYAEGLQRIMAQEAILIHPDDAERLGFSEGEKINIAAGENSITAQAPLALSKRVAPGTLFFQKDFAFDVRKGLPLDVDPITRVPYGNFGVVRLLKAPA